MKNAIIEIGNDDGLVDETVSLQLNIEYFIFLFIIVNSIFLLVLLIILIKKEGRLDNDKGK